MLQQGQAVGDGSLCTGIMGRVFIHLTDSTLLADRQRNDEQVDPGSLGGEESNHGDAAGRDGGGKR